MNAWHKIRKYVKPTPLTVRGPQYIPTIVRFQMWRGEYNAENVVSCEIPLAKLKPLSPEQRHNLVTARMTGKLLDLIPWDQPKALQQAQAALLESLNTVDWEIIS